MVGLVAIMSDGSSQLQTGESCYQSPSGQLKMKVLLHFVYFLCCFTASDFVPNGDPLLRSSQQVCSYTLLT